jgi:hypothetical protein
VVAAGANRHDSPLLGRTLETVEASTELPEDATVHLDRACVSKVTRELLEDRGLVGLSLDPGASWGSFRLVSIGEVKASGTAVLGPLEVHIFICSIM